MTFCVLRSRMETPMDTKKKLYRSTSDRVIAGLAGGLADYFGIDSTVVRLAMVVLAVLSGGGPMILVYIIAWLIIPKDKEDAVEARDSGKPRRARRLFGFAFLILGLIILVDHIVPDISYRMPMHDYYRQGESFFWPAVLIIIGIWVLTRGGRGKGTHDSGRHQSPPVHEPHKSKSGVF